ncbi:unnamed protein product [Arabis nemorensis]|uniref:Uncharacterized protein n=1 Tax=Arabis nemorensis TaxID=586526 RepID=A0A565BA01_9BRAS|nr:unnamed protein product [Arabis nemorensis]
MGNSLKPFKQQPRSMAYEPLISVSVETENEHHGTRVFSLTELKKATKKFRQSLYSKILQGLHRRDHIFSIKK